MSPRRHAASDALPAAAGGVLPAEGRRQGGVGPAAIVHQPVSAPDAERHVHETRRFREPRSWATGGMLAV